jgi:hypothetical protein
MPCRGANALSRPCARPAAPPFPPFSAAALERSPLPALSLPFVADCVASHGMSGRRRSTRGRARRRRVCRWAPLRTRNLKRRLFPATRLPPGRSIQRSAQIASSM